MLFFKRKLTLTFSLKICSVLITHYRVVAIVFFSHLFPSFENVATKMFQLLDLLYLNFFFEMVENRKLSIILDKIVADRKVNI